MDEQPRRKKRHVPPARRFAAKRMYSLAVGVVVAGLLVGFVVGRATAPVDELPDQPVVEELVRSPSDANESDTESESAIVELPEGPNGLEVVRMIGNQYPIDLDSWSISDEDRGEVVDTVSRRLLEANHNTRMLTNVEEEVLLSQYRRNVNEMIDDVIGVQRLMTSTVVAVVGRRESRRYNQVCDYIAESYDLLDPQVRNMLRSSPREHVEIAAANVE